MRPSNVVVLLPPSAPVPGTPGARPIWQARLTRRYAGSVDKSPGGRQRGPEESVGDHGIGDGQRRGPAEIALPLRWLGRAVGDGSGRHIRWRRGTSRA